MRAAFDMNSVKPELRWTPVWVFFVSVITPASAWMLHTVNPDLVAWYLGAMAWLTMTPSQRPRWFAVNQATATLAGSSSLIRQEGSSHPKKEPSASSNPSAEASSEIGTLEIPSSKTKKARTKARKPKAVTLAEMKMLTGGTDRAMVWSQVGPGKFVRQAGEEAGETEGDSSPDSQISRPSGNMVIEAVVSNSKIIEPQSQPT